MSPSRRSPIYALAVGLAVLIGSPPTAAHADQAGTTLWEARWQHIRLIPRDGGTANAQPTQLDKNSIRNGLAQLQLATGSGEPVEFLTAEERAFVAEQLSRALAKAGPDQDVSVATIGMRKTFLGMNEPRLTTLRAFVGEGGLNIIIGEAQAEPPNDTSTYQKVDPRLVTLPEGQRSGPVKAEPGWKLVAAANSGITLKRGDWATIPASAMTVPEPGTPQAVKQEQDRIEQMQQQMKQMQQQMQQVQTAPPQAAPAPQATSPAQPGVEDRLATLDRLKAKGLITPKEYAAKRKQILDSF